MLSWSRRSMVNPTQKPKPGRLQFEQLETRDLMAVLLANWNFDQIGTTIGATIADASDNGRDLTLSAIGQTDVKGPATLDSGDLNSLRFPLHGTASNNALNLSPTEEIGSFAFWLRPEDFAVGPTTDPRVVMEFGGDNGVKVVLGSWTTGVHNEAISLVLGNAAIPAQITSIRNVTRSANQWVHVAFVWSAADSRYDAYLNGIQQSVGTLDVPSHAQRFTAGSIRIGSRNASPNFDLRSQLDDIRLYSGSLTSSEIESLAVNLIARWNFDHDIATSTLAQDASGTGRDLALSGIGVSDWKDGATPTSADTYSVRFPVQGFATNNNLNLPDSETIDTIAFWLKTEGFVIDRNADPHVVMEFGGDEGVKVVVGSWAVGVQNETISLVLGNSGTPLQITSVADAARFANQWTHIAFAWSPTDQHYDIYIDGEKPEVISLNSESHVQRFAANTVRLGSRNMNPHLDLRSQLDDVRLYHGSLPQSEIRAFAGNLLAHWNFDDNSNPFFTVDSSGNENTLTVNGSTGFATPATTQAGDLRSMRFAKFTRGFNSPNPFVLPPGRYLDSIAFWLRPEDFDLSNATDAHVVMELGGDSGVKVVLGSWTSAVAGETISIVLGNSATPAQITSFTGINVPEDTWAHIALVWSYADDRFDLYVNAVKVTGYTSDTPSHVSRFRADSILIGSRNASPQLDLLSHLDDIRFYHGVLSLADITRLSQNPNN